MTYVDAFDNEGGLLTGVGLLALLPLLVGSLWLLEGTEAETEAGVSAGASAIGTAGGVTVAFTLALVLLLVAALTAFHRLETRTAEQS